MRTTLANRRLWRDTADEFTLYLAGVWLRLATWRGQRKPGSSRSD